MTRPDPPSIPVMAVESSAWLPMNMQLEPQSEFLIAAANADEAALRALFEKGVEIDMPDKRTGLTALHLAVGRDALAATQLLIDHGAKFLPDALGRMPSAIAAECEVSEAMCDLIAEAEAKAEDV